MQVVNVLFTLSIAEWTNIIKDVNGPHSVNVKSLYSANKSYLFNEPTRYRLCKKNSLDPEDINYLLQAILRRILSIRIPPTVTNNCQDGSSSKKKLC